MIHAIREGDRALQATLGPRDGPTCKRVFKTSTSLEHAEEKSETGGGVSGASKEEAAAAAVEAIEHAAEGCLLSIWSAALVCLRSYVSL